MGQDKNNRPTGTAQPPGQGAGNGRSAGKGRGDEAKDRDMGSALRTVYQKTVDEKIPDDLLDLLGKLN